ncbi:MAG: ATP-binding protein [Holophaga sp.]|nr:ATP-binding protein [Holophaga sp.]
MLSLREPELNCPWETKTGDDLVALVDHRESVPASLTVDQVFRSFRNHPHTFVAVVDHGTYTGLISRAHLGFLLGTRYGFALHSEHLIQSHVLPDCLVASPAMPLLELLERALSRTGETFYQDVPLVDGDGGFLGIIPVPALVRAQSALFADQIQLAGTQRQELLTTNQELFRSLHQLRQSQGRYETLFQHSPLAVALLYPDGRIDTRNEQLQTMLGAGEGEGMPNLADLMPPKHREAFLERLRLHESGMVLAPDDQADEFQLRLAAGGERLFKFHTSLVRETGQICTILQDITEQRAVQRRMALSDKTALFESLAGGIAHELNNTLSPVLGYAELLTMRLEAEGDQPTLLSYCQRITKSTQESVRIIRQLLQLSRPATMELRKVDLRAILDEAVAIMRFRLRSSTVQLSLQVPESGVRILADAVQIKQVLINLLINAVDAMEHTIRKELTVRMTVRDGMAELRVQDTGHGIPPEKLNRIFDPFYTTKSAERGTGLGLSVCLGIVGQHRGEIAVSSVPGEGTLFTVQLPLAPGAGEADPPPASLEQALAPEPPVETMDLRPRLDVLVIDDEEYITSLVHELLRNRLGWRVEQVHDGREAIQRLESAPFDLVITDLRMPGLDGFALLGWIRDFRPALLPKVLVITGDSGSLSQDRELRDLGIPALKKPFTSDELVAHCRDLVAAS